MGHLKTSFLLIIAILSLGITAATNANVLESKKVVPPEYCYQNLIALNASCLDVPLLINSSSCANAQPPVEGVRTVGAFITNDCDEIEEKFCCAQLTVDTSPCPTVQAPVTFIDIVDGQSKTAFAKIHRVFCMAVE